MTETQARPTVLEAVDLSAGFRAKTPFVQGVNLALRSGEITALIGPNGAGKSTVLRTLSGLLPSLAGSVRLFGEELDSVPPAVRAKKLAVVLTDATALGAATAWEAAALGRTPHTDFWGTLSAADKRAVDEALTLAGAESLGPRQLNRLSDGEKQKVALARALAQEPAVLVMDEPLSFLDIKHKIEVALLLKRLALEKGVAVILSLHDIEIALCFATNLVLMKEGRVVTQGDPEAVLKGKAIDALFGIQGLTFEALISRVTKLLTQEETP